MKFAEFGGRQSEFSTHEAPVLNQSAALKITHIVRNALTERHVAHAGFEIAPYVIDVHRYVLALLARLFGESQFQIADRLEMPLDDIGGHGFERIRLPARIAIPID